MKNSVLIIGYVLVTLANICYASNVVYKQNFSFQAEILHENNISNEIQTFKFNYANLDSVTVEVIEGINTHKIEKTPEELIAEGNAIKENNISNETQALDFKVINGNPVVKEFIENGNANKIEKTTDELIAKDNSITENIISNETQALDFNIINHY